MALNLDMDVLRTLIAAHHLGAFNRAAKMVGRSESAISQQISKLEDRIGQALFRKRARGLVPTEAGEIILAYARRIVDLNDEAVAALSGTIVGGVARIGVPGDFSENWLPAALGRFNRSYPNVKVEVTVDRNAMLIDRLEKGHLDLALLLTRKARVEAETLATLPMVWIGRRNGGGLPASPVSLALLEAPCAFRAAAIDALDNAGISWKIGFTTPNVSGLWAAVNAGIGITARSAASVPKGLVALDASTELPGLPMVHVFLSSAGREISPSAADLKDALLATMPANLHSQRPYTTALPEIAA
jgi:DNA-binding transcriptional LysR family regulator